MKEIDRYSEDLEKELMDLPYDCKIKGGIFIPESDYGFAEIYRIYDNIFVFLIPTYGGAPYLHKTIKANPVEIKSLVEELRRMT